jgi:hypothetical protein
MKAEVIVTLDNGQRLRGKVQLSYDGNRAAEKASSHPPTKVSLDFHLGIRAFMKRHAGPLSGPKKFALMVAYFSKGALASDVKMKEIERAWNKMRPIMGGEFNAAYAVRAKDEGWVDSPKRGSYVLLSHLPGFELGVAKA